MSKGGPSWRGTPTNVDALAKSYQPLSCLSPSIKPFHFVKADMATSQAEVDPMSDPEERRVLYSTLDSFR